MNYKVTALTLCCIAYSAYAENFFNDHARGWHWYEQILKNEKKKKPIKDARNHASKTAMSKENLEDPSTLINIYQKILKKSLDRALVDPSEENLLTYMQLQKDSIERSNLFANAWQKVVLSTPSLDDTLKFPVSQLGRHVYYEQEKKAIHNKIRNLKDRYGLYFFFQGKCPYCHSFAPIIKSFARQYGWTVFAVSLDGSSLSQFPNATRDNGMAAKIGVTTVPSLFVANPQKGQIFPIAHGLVSQADIENRILLITNNAEGGYK